MKTLIGVMLVVGLLGLLWAAGIARADTAWIDEVAKSMSFFKTNYPNANWQPYSHKLEVVRDAVQRGDQKAIKREMGQWFQMLRQRDHGISEVAADELFNFSLMVTPVQDYGIAVPGQTARTSEFAY